MSNWVGGLPFEPLTQNDKKANKSGKPNGGYPKTFYGGAIPPIPPKLPKYKKEEPPPKYKKEEPPPKVKITGAGPPISKDPIAEPKAPPPSPPAMPPMPSPPPPPPSSPVSEPTPQSYSLPLLPKRLPSLFDKKPKKKGKKKKKKKKKPPPPPLKPIECCDDDDVCSNHGDCGQLPSIFAICHIPATRQGQDDYGGDVKKEGCSGHASPCSQEENEGLDIPPMRPDSSMRPDEFARIFGKEIDARNLADVGPHGWHPTANAPYDIRDTGDTVTVGPTGWFEQISE